MLPIPATADEFRQLEPRIDAMLANVAQAEIAGLLLLLEEALHGKDFIASFRVWDRAQRNFSTQLTRGASPGESDDEPGATLLNLPHEAELARLAAFSGLDPGTLAQAHMAIFKASCDLLNALKDGGEQILKRGVRITAKDATEIATQFGLPEAAAQIERARLSRAAFPGAPAAARPAAL